MRTTLFLCTLSLLATILTLSSTTHAQPGNFTPTHIFIAQSAFIEGKALYINGGLANGSNHATLPIDQTFYLDLSVPWNTSAPAFYQLPSPRYPGMGFTSTIYNNSRTWMVGYNTTRQALDLTTNRWTIFTSRPDLNPSASVWAVTDAANSDLIYLVNGWSNLTFETAIMNRTENTLELVPASVPLAGGHAAVWSSLRKSILVYGGYSYNPKVVQHNLYEFLPSNPAYDLKIEAGERPQARYGHCLVEAYNVTVDPATKAYSLVKEPMVIYNLRTGEWQTTFDPSKWAEPSHDSIFGIRYIYLAAGGGGLVLLFVLLGIFFYFRKKREERRYFALQSGGYGPQPIHFSRAGLGSRSGGRGDTQHIATSLMGTAPASSSNRNSASFVAAQHPPMMTEINKSGNTIYYSEKAPIQIRTHDPVTGYPVPHSQVKFFELPITASAANVAAAPVAVEEDKKKRKDKKKTDSISEAVYPLAVSLDQLPKKLYSRPPPELHHRFAEALIKKTKDQSKKDAPVSKNAKKKSNNVK
ncbi:hypothetical protein BGX33_003108 [Mortierella sp. NVP41]|nr:hypothetical protein BGX33_003108 [Mortierella sp. NVP41]